MRLQKFIAQAGIASRRQAEELIRHKQITINGQTAQIGDQVDPEKDEVKHLGKIIKPIQQKTHLILNKPVGYITTRKDTHNRPTVYDLIPEELAHVVPAGRLDLNTSGLLILSNDGDIIHKITHPSHELEKTYLVTAHGKLTHKQIQELENGVKIEENFTTSPARIEHIETTVPNTQFEITIHEGRNRQIRKMLEAVGSRVAKLHRQQIGALKFPGLKLGKYQELNSQQINQLLNKK